MDADHWRRLRGAFEGAVALAGAERARYLDRVCGPDLELRAEVEGLIRQDAAPDGRLEPPERTSRDLDPGLGPRRIGPYELERVLGDGGMGTVYLARRTDEHFTKRV